MDAKTLEALHGSIQKWTNILEGTEEDNGHDNCPLCKLFYHRTSCSTNCPVKTVTGQDWCRGTPYSDYTNEPDDMNAQAELDFLISLLPKDGAET